jgi:hypothetical protein
MKMLEPGKCRVCGCTELNPCLSRGGDGNPVEPCAWLDFDHTLCSSLRCVAMVTLDSSSKWMRREGRVLAIFLKIRKHSRRIHENER